LINGHETNQNYKRLHREGVTHLVVLHIPSVNMYICRYNGNRQLFLNGHWMSAVVR